MCFITTLKYSITVQHSKTSKKYNSKWVRKRCFPTSFYTKKYLFLEPFDQRYLNVAYYLILPKATFKQYKNVHMVIYFLNDNPTFLESFLQILKIRLT